MMAWLRTGYIDTLMVTPAQIEHERQNLLRWIGRRRGHGLSRLPLASLALRRINLAALDEHVEENEDDAWPRRSRSKPESTAESVQGTLPCRTMKARESVIEATPELA